MIARSMMIIIPLHVFLGIIHAFLAMLVIVLQNYAPRPSLEMGDSINAYDHHTIALSLTLTKSYNDEVYQTRQQEVSSLLEMSRIIS